MSTSVDLGQVQINTRIDGPDGAPWIVLSNSLGSNLSMWDPQMDLLTKTHRVLRYDTRGHGGSSSPKGPYSFDDLVADAIGIMDHHGVERADWMGLSMGAMTGMGLALQHGARFRRMILADGRADSPPANQNMWDDRIKTVEAGGTEAVADGSIGMWVSEDWRTANPKETAALREMITSTDPAGYIGCCQAIRELDYLRHLPKLTLPVLYVVGGEDKGAPPDVMRAMAEATPGARFVEIPGAGHIANVNAPEAYNAAISAFLAG